MPHICGVCIRFLSYFHFSAYRQIIIMIIGAMRSRPGRLSVGSPPWLPLHAASRRYGAWHDGGGGAVGASERGWHTTDSYNQQPSKGYEWKSRDLTDRRVTALTYMCDVSKRTPIHDGVRLRAKMNAQRLRNWNTASIGQPRTLKRDGECASDASPGSPVDDLDHSGASDALAISMRHSVEIPPPHTADTRQPTATGAEAAVQGLFDDLTSLKEEGADSDDGAEEAAILRSLQGLPRRSIDELKDELLFGGRAASRREESQMLRDWFRLRNTQATSSMTRSFGRSPEDRTFWSAWYLEDVAAGCQDGCAPIHRDVI